MYRLSLKEKKEKPKKGVKWEEGLGSNLQVLTVICHRQIFKAKLVLKFIEV